MKAAAIWTLFILLFAPWEALSQDVESILAEGGSFVDRKRYNEGLDEQLKIYSRITYEEISSLRRETREAWGDDFLSTASLWVDYSPDMSSRKSVNFDTGAISIEIKKSSGGSPEDFMRLIADLISATTETVFHNDPLVMGIESRMKEYRLDAVYSDVEAEPVLAKIATGIDNPTPAEINDRAAEIFAAGSVRDIILGNGERAVQFDGRIDMTETSRENLGDMILDAEITSGSIHKKAGEYRGAVETYSRKYGLPAALVYAIIHNESSFNPFATSYIPAYGLMQLVPQSAGLSASKEVFGRKMILSPSYLYEYANNIQMGSIYLSQIYYGYFADVKNERSRLYCAIAAYNTGAGNVARAFTGTLSVRAAVAAINAMTSRECYGALMENLPYDQTKAYLRRVVRSFNAYSGY